MRYEGLFIYTQCSVIYNLFAKTRGEVTRVMCNLIFSLSLSLYSVAFQPFLFFHYVILCME